tara:strand:+ start:4103 stop:5164 length:1062 start_codon:yes stop_codon:yes gene_type:complete
MKKCNSKIYLIMAVLAIMGEIKAQISPYPPSPAVKFVTWDMTIKTQNGLGSDQWPMTWAEDNNLYAAWGDGWGWDKGEEPKRSIGITRITGSPPNFTGEDLWGAGPGQNFGKPDALVAIDKKLLMFWVNGDSRYDHDSYSAVSIDNGKTWELGKERLFPYAPAGFRVRGIVQYGKAYENAPDDYVYIYFGFNRHPDIYLARVKKESIFKSMDYEWFNYIKADGEASWTPDFTKKATVFHDNNAYLWHLSIVYNPGLKRYLMVKPHFTSEDNRDTILADVSSLGIFDAPNPWGPWTTVYYKDYFLDKLVKFNYIIPAKFLSYDGKSFWLGWSGWPEYDNINFIKGQFELFKEKP